MRGAHLAFARPRLVYSGEIMTGTSLVQLLIHRLGPRNVSLDHIPGLVRNVLQIISDGGFFTTRLVNGRLEQLGWGPEILDETSFQLIVCILESEWGYRARRYNLGSTEQLGRQIGGSQGRRSPSLNQPRELNYYIPLPKRKEKYGKNPGSG